MAANRAASVKTVAPPATDPSARTSAPKAVTRTRMRRVSSRRSSFFDGVFSAARSFFEAASRSLRLEKATDPGPSGMNGEIERLRERSRWMYANDPNYRNACRKIADNVVGYGIKPIIKDPILRDLFAKWEKEADARGRQNFFGLMYTAGHTLPRDGEFLVRFRERKPGDMESGIDFQLQCMEADHLPLDYTKQSPDGGRWIVSGVERDAIDRVIRYWLYDYHPKDWRGTGQAKDAFTPKPVSAEQVLHVYMPERFGDSRGYPWASSALNIVESLRTYDEAELERKKGQSMFGGFFKKPRLAVADDGGVGEEEDGDAPEFQPLEPNTWVQVPEDWDVELAQPTATDNNYEAYRRENLASLSVAMGLAVELVTLNFKALGNERIFRALMFEVQRYVESLQWHLFIHQFCEPIWRRFVAEAYRKQLWKPEPGKSVEDYFIIEWRPPVRHHIHPVQEIDAWLKAIENGLTSRKRVVAEFGEDVEDIDAENVEDMARAAHGKLAYPVYPKLAETIDTGILKSTVNDYGVAVRAGAITPQPEDEEAYRASFGLPPMGDKAKAFWAEQGGVKQPITLSVKKDMLEDPESGLVPEVELENDGV